MCLCGKAMMVEKEGQEAFPTTQHDLAEMGYMHVTRT